MQITGRLDEIMDNEDWALIFDNYGRIKGIFIPKGYEDTDAPESMVSLLKRAGISIGEGSDTVVH
jgi:hypothetical protein